MKAWQKLKAWESIPIALGLVIGVLGVFGLPERFGLATSQQIIIGILSLILAAIVSFYVRQYEGIESRLKGIDYSIRAALNEMQAPDPHSLDRLLLRRGERVEARRHLRFSEIARPNAEILVAGISCINLLNVHRTDIELALRAGARFRFVLVNPDVSFLGLYDANMSNASDATRMRSDILQAASILEPLRAEGSLEFRFYSGVPMYSAVWLRSEGNNTIIVEFYTYGGSPATRPSFAVDQSHSATWYNFFVRSLEQLWSASKAVPSKVEVKHEARNP